MIVLFPCPTDLKPGEQIEIYECNLAPHGEILGTVDSVIYNTIWVKVTKSPIGGIGGIFPIDPVVTKWRRVTAAAELPPKSKGAYCTDRYCPIGFFEYAEQTPNFKCYSCRNR